MNRRVLALLAACAMSSPAFSDASNCTQQRNDLENAQDEMDQFRLEWNSMEERTQADLVAFEGKFRRMQRQISRSREALAQCRNEALLKRNTDAIDAQAETFRAEIQTAGEQRIAAEQARSDVYESKASLAEQKSAYAREIQFDAMRIREQYIARPVPARPARPGVSEDDAIASLQQQTDDQLGSMVRALTSQEGTPDRGRPDTVVSTTETEHASSSAAKRLLEAVREPSVRKGLAEVGQDLRRHLGKRGTSASSMTAKSITPTSTPDEGAQGADANKTSGAQSASESSAQGGAPNESSGAPSPDCPESMEHLRSSIRTPELRSGPLTTVSATIEAAGGVERAILLFRGQVDLFEETLEVHLANTRLREMSSEQYRRYEQATRDTLMVNRAYLEACECRLGRGQR